MARFRLIVGDVRERLRDLPAESVQCVVTSPPYWGLRDYGTGTWEGGDPSCAHRVGGQVQDSKAPGAITCGVRPGVDASRCLDCGARRIDRQIGLERTPEEYVAKMVEVFREVRRVLRADGVAWVNLGDCYATGAGAVGECPGGGDQGARWAGRGTNIVAANGRGERRPEHTGKHTGIVALGPMTQPNRMPLPGLKPKDLVGIPWRVAFALQADGWWLRCDVIWNKPNPMPSSVRDRPTTAHEYVFLLSKSEHYFYDADAIREPFADERMGRDGGTAPSERNRGGRTDGFTTPSGIDPSANGGRNKRSVWTITPQPFPGAHFATYPEKLVEPCILAGSKPGDVVLDPFAGSGTTGVVAFRRGRDFWGIELKPEYAAMAERRIRNVTPQFPGFDVAANDSSSHAPGEDDADDAPEAEPDEGPGSQAVDA